MKENELKGQTAHLIGLNNINVIMGRNGAGKSRFLRDIEEITNRSKQLSSIMSAMSAQSWLGLSSATAMSSQT